MFYKQWMDTPIVPVMLYDCNNSPFHNGMVDSICPELSQYGGYMIAAIANEAGLKVNQNQARTYCYNLLVQNSFNNQDTSEVLGYLCKAVLLGLRRRQYNTPEQGINSEVTRILSMFTSVLLFRYDGLKSSCAPAVVNAAYQNVENFNLFKQEIDTMNQYVNQQGYPMGYPVVNNQPMMPPMLPPGMMVYPNGQIGPIPQNMMQPMQASGPVYTGMTSNNIGMQSFGRPSGNMVRMEHSSAPDSTFQRFSDDNRGNGNVQMETNRFQGNHVKQNRHFREEPKPEVKVEVKKEPSLSSQLDIEGGSEMDRAKHRVTVIDQVLTVNIGDKFQKLSASIDAHITKNDRYVTENDNGIFATTIGSLINNARIRRLILDKNRNSNLFISNGYLIDTFFSSTDGEFKQTFAEIKRDLHSCVSFKEIASVLRKHMLRITVDVEQPIKDNVYKLITSLDKKLTLLVNDFIKKDLRIPKLFIDEFSGDILSFEKYCVEKEDGRYYNPYRNFEEVVVGIIFMNNEEIMNIIEQGLVEGMTDDLKENFSYLTTTSEIGVALINMTSNEMGFKFGDGVNIIGKEKFPNLHKLSKALWEDQYEYEKVFIVTTDDIVYQLHKDYLNYGNYAISLYK